MRLIDADALYEEANKTALGCNGCVDTLIGMDYVRCMVKRMPTVDPVKHAHWNKYGLYLECSSCFKGQDYEHCPEPNYCPNCGAKMD